MPHHLLKCVVAPLLLVTLCLDSSATTSATRVATEISTPISADIVDADGQRVSREQLLKTLAAADIVLIGEIHDQASHHHAEQWLLANLHALRPQRALALEMVGSDRQNRLDNVRHWYAAGNRARPQRLRELLDWDTRWDWTAYGPLLEQALQTQIPLYAANVSRAELTGLRQTQDNLPTTARQRLAAMIMEMHGGEIPEQMLSSMLAIQQARDVRMAQVLQAVDKPALLVAGRMHVLRGTGVPGYLDPAKSNVIVVVLASADEQIQSGDADYIWHLPRD